MAAITLLGSTAVVTHLGSRAAITHLGSRAAVVKSELKTEHGKATVSVQVADLELTPISTSGVGGHVSLSIGQAIGIAVGFVTAAVLLSALVVITILVLYRKLHFCFGPKLSSTSKTSVIILVCILVYSLLL